MKETAYAPLPVLTDAEFADLLKEAGIGNAEIQEILGTNV